MDLKAKETVKNEDREMPGPFFLHKNRLKVEKLLTSAENRYIIKTDR